MKKQVTMIEGFDFLLDFSGLEEITESSETVAVLIAAVFSGMIPVDPQTISKREEFIKDASDVMEKEAAEKLYEHLHRSVSELELDEDEAISASQQLKLRDKLRKTMPAQFRDLSKNLSDFANASNLDESRAGYMHSKAFKRLRSVLKPEVTDDQIITALFILRNQAVVDILLHGESEQLPITEEKVKKAEKSKTKTKSKKTK